MRCLPSIGALPASRLYVFGLPIVLLILVSGCSRATWQGVAAGAAAAGGPNNPAVAAGSELLVFGGNGHHVFLGCLSCSKYDTDSVFNTYGTYGSRLSPESLLNPHSDYGSRDSPHGACSPYATDPPVVADRAGRHYGRLTVNKSAGPIQNSTVLAWLVGVCSGSQRNRE